MSEHSSHSQTKAAAMRRNFQPPHQLPERSFVVQPKHPSTRPSRSARSLDRIQQLDAGVLNTLATASIPTSKGSGQPFVQRDTVIQRDTFGDAVQFESLDGSPLRIITLGPYTDEAIAEELYGDATMPIRRAPGDHSTILIDYNRLRDRWQPLFAQSLETEAIQAEEAAPVVSGIGEVETADQITGPTDWTTEDRTSNSQRWQDACLHNLLSGNSAVYVRIEQRRDFYRWFYEYHAARGWTTRWAFAASIVANGAQQVAYPSVMAGLFGEGSARMTGSISNELQGFMRIGNQVIFDNVFPKLKELHEGGPLTGQAALEWDMQILSEEQQLIQPLYEGVAAETIEQLETIARQSGFVATVGSWLTSEDSVDAGNHNLEGDVPAFPDDEPITSVDSRWRYGMRLGDQFTPGGTGYAEGTHARPEPSDEYTRGDALAAVHVRPHLHMLDAQLENAGYAEISTVRSLLQQLLPGEQEELARDRSPDGFRYSDRLSMMPRIQHSDIEAALPSEGAAREAFLQNFDRYRPRR
ncbi:MAG: hypothetical protein AAFQ89_04840 [Cyanobacteria bacterium J06626_18]